MQAGEGVEECFCLNTTPLSINPIRHNNKCFFQKKAKIKIFFVFLQPETVKWGRKSPLLLHYPQQQKEPNTTVMIDKLHVLNVIDTALAGSNKFLVDLKISTDNRINVAIDGDNGITIDDCIELSRAIEGSLDRDEEDFELNVASAGLDSPLKLKRQYRKNIGRELSVTTFDGENVTGRLTEADETHIVVQPAGKKKAPAEPVSFEYSDIKTAKIVINF